MDSRVFYRLGGERLFISRTEEMYRIWNYFYDRCEWMGEAAGDGRLTSRTHVWEDVESIVFLIKFDS